MTTLKLKDGMLRQGAVECRSREGKTFAEFGSFGQAIRALVKSGVSYANIFEMQPDRVLFPVCEYEVANDY